MCIRDRFVSTMDPATGAAARVIQSLIRGLRDKHTEHELLDKLRRTIKVVLDVELTDKQVDQSVLHIEQVMSELAGHTAPTEAAPSNKRARSEPTSEGLPKLLRVSDDQTSCLLYTSPSPRDRTRSRMPSSA
eukprot:TRINITY_DN4801_c0_g1_i1.p1 TRINITY_DN4801_c0_g1~~TRINITY_DN4801_c0_g1_i1.p1  ORF type:complete len:132 (-),score=54.79 TRINITY_DN4801_c0_g1_i1:43-438(-)